MEGKQKQTDDEQARKESPLKGFTDMDITFYLEEDGRVVISDLPEELLDLVRELDPEAEIFCTIDYPRHEK